MGGKGWEGPGISFSFLKCFLKLLLFKKKSIYLVVLGLSCGTQDLSVAACGN